MGSLQLGPSCCCPVATATCLSIEIPVTFGVEFYGDVSDPGGDDFCDDYVGLSVGFPDILRDRYFQYAPELADFFETAIEVQWVTDSPCDWCLPPTSDYNYEDPYDIDDPTILVNCPDIAIECEGLLVLGDHSYGFEDAGDQITSVSYDCAGSPTCTNDGTLTLSSTLFSIPYMMTNCSVSFSSTMSGIQVDVSFVTRLGWGVRSTSSLSCDGSTNCWPSYGYICNGGIALTILEGDFSKEFTGSPTWEDIKDVQIPGTITAYGDGGTTCATYNATGYGFVVPTSVGSCGAGGPTCSFSAIGDAIFPRLLVENAYCILRDI